LHQHHVHGFWKCAVPPCSPLSRPPPNPAPLRRPQSPHCFCPPAKPPNIQPLWLTELTRGLAGGASSMSKKGSKAGLMSLFAPTVAALKTDIDAGPVLDRRRRRWRRLLNRAAQIGGLGPTGDSKPYSRNKNQ